MIGTMQVLHGGVMLNERQAIAGHLINKKTMTTATDLKSTLEKMNSLYVDDRHGFVHDLSILLMEAEGMSAEEMTNHFKSYTSELIELNQENN